LNPRARFALGILSAVAAAVSTCSRSAPTRLADPPPTGSTLAYHATPDRAGLTIGPLLPKSAAARMSTLPGFNTSISGPLYAQPLFMAGGVNGPGGTPGGARDALFVVTEHDDALALDAATGAVLWTRTVGTPVALASLPCGNIDPLGITGTPEIDPVSRTLYFDAMTTSDGGSTMSHQLYALSIDDGFRRADALATELAVDRLVRAQGGLGSPLVTRPDGTGDFVVVWTLGAEGDNRLRALDGETGAMLYASPALPQIRRFETPIAARGTIYVPTDSGLFAFSAPAP
jgi:outer membrane protein assembly factor BamB